MTAIPHHPAAVDATGLRPQACARSWSRALNQWARWQAPTPAAAAAARRAARAADVLRRELEAAEAAAG